LISFRQNLTKKPSDKKLLFWFGLFCIALTLFRVTWLYAINLPLYGDEAQYWAWSQDLNFGYYSKPPVIAWLIWLSTSIFGDSEASIRLTSPILHLATTLFVYKIALRLFNKNVAFWSAFTYITLPAVFLSSILVSTDAPLMFLWAASFYYYLKAISKNALGDWILLGIFAGLGLLTKYSMGIFSISVLAHILIIKKHSLFLNKNVWISAGIATLFFIPNLYWNFVNDFPSFSHTYDLAQGRQNEHFSIKNGFSFFFAQLAIIGPILFPALFFSFRDKKTRSLQIFTFTFLIIITLISFYSRAHANWAAPAYIAGTILAVYVIAGSRYPNLLKISIGLHCFIGLFAMMYLTFDDLKTSNTPLGRLYATHELANQYRTDYYNDKHKILVFDDRMVLSVFKYYLRDTDIKFIKWNPAGAVKDHFDLTTNLDDYARNDIIVLSNWLTLPILKNYAKEASVLTHIDSSQNFGKHSKSLTLYYLEDFHGY